MVACIIQAIAKHVFNTVVHKIPEQLKEALQGAAFAAVDTVKSAADGALRKMPCAGFLHFKAILYFKANRNKKK